MLFLLQLCLTLPISVQRSLFFNSPQYNLDPVLLLIDFLYLVTMFLLCSLLCFLDFSFCMFQDNFEVYVFIQTPLLNFNKCLKWLLMPPHDKL